MALVKYTGAPSKVARIVDDALALAKSPAGKAVRKVLTHPETKRLGSMALQAGQALASSAWNRVSALFGTKSNSRAVSAPASVGMVNSAGFKWAFGIAPDVGLGPGVRLQCRFRCPGLETRAAGTSMGFQISAATNSGVPLLVVDPSVSTAVGDQATYPAIFHEVAGLQTFSKCFSRYFFRHIALDYQPLLATNAAGSVALGFNTDCARLDTQLSTTTNGTNYNIAQGVMHNYAGPVWTPAHVVLHHVPPATRISPADLFYVHTESATPAGSAEGRFEIQGAVIAGTFGVGDSVLFAVPMLEIVCDFYEPAIVTTGVALRPQTQNFFGSKAAELRIATKLQNLLIAEAKLEKKSGSSTAVASDSSHDAQDDETACGGRGILIQPLPRELQDVSAPKLVRQPPTPSQPRKV